MNDYIDTDINDVNINTVNKENEPTNDEIMDQIIKEMGIDNKSMIEHK